MKTNKTKYIYAPSIKTRDGRVIHARSYGKKAFRFPESEKRKVKKEKEQTKSSKKAVVYVSPSRHFGSEARLFTTHRKALLYGESSTNTIFIVDKKEFSKFLKQGTESYIQTPIDWAFNRLDRNFVYGTL